MIFINVVVINESMRELAQNIVRVQIDKRRYFLFLILSADFLSRDIMNDAEENKRNIGRNMRYDGREDKHNKIPFKL